MDRDSTLLEEAYLRIAEMYYGHYDDREDPYHSESHTLSFFLPDTFEIGNKTYIVHFYCDDANISGNPEASKKDLNTTYKNKKVLIWNADKTPEIWKFFNEEKTFVDNLSDEIINAAIINYPDKNPDFFKKYQNNILYGIIIREIYRIADETLWEKWEPSSD